MRSILFVAGFSMISVFALAYDVTRIDLDRPGVLEQLEQQHPQRYQAVSAVLRAAERAPCPGSEAELLKTRFNVRDLECGMQLFTRYPALRHVSFELDGTSYTATVALKDDNAAQPVSTAAPQAHR
jgi:hypothetical protein